VRSVFQLGEKNPSELEVATMDREQIDKFIEVTGKLHFACKLARELSFRLNNASITS